MELAATTIWYNPQTVENCVQKILSYSPFVRVYIIDNSSCDHSDLAAEIPGVVYIPIFKNIGIAAAQNIGCRRALEDGFEWIMTMDQDSYFGDEQFQRYLQKADNYSRSDNKAASFSVSIKDVSSHVLPLTLFIKKTIKTILIKYFNYPSPPKTDREELDHPDRVFASANIIKLSVWEEVGGFDETLFIDEVDFDFCIRIRMAGYYITRFNTLYLNHSLGNKKFTIFPKVTYHNGKRLFYIIRNKLIENRRYRFVNENRRNYRKEIYRYFKDYCIFNWKAIQNWGIFIRAFFAYKDFIKTDSIFLKLKEKGLAR